MPADSQLPKILSDPPELPAGLVAEIRARLAVLQLLHEGRGHITMRLDVAGSLPAKWEFDVGGKGQEARA